MTKSKSNPNVEISITAVFTLRNLLVYTAVIAGAVGLLVGLTIGAAF